MRAPILSLSAAFILLALPSSSRAQIARLETGPFSVGFRELLVRDVSRPALSPRAKSGDRGREMQIVVWYPARPGTGSRMTLGDYIVAAAHETDFSPIDTARRRAALNRFVQRSGAMGGDSASLRAALPRILAENVNARSGAAPNAGRFPLVLFPDWRAPSANSILGEFLASHGYVVASVSTKGTYEEELDYWSPRGIETIVADLRFTISALDTLRFVDAQRIGVMGVGFAASGALALQMRTPAVAALVSLAGGITTEGELNLISRTPYFEPANVTVPILSISDPHPSVEVARLDLYRYSTRHIVHFPAMGEFWFLNFGMLEKVVPNIIGRRPGDTEAGFTWAARYVRRFFDAYIKRDSVSREWIAADPRSIGAPAGLFNVGVKAGLRPPPSVADVRELLERGGVAALDSLIQSRVVSDPQPIPSEHFVELNAWLGSGHDPSGTERYRLAQLRVRLYPSSVRARFSLGSLAQRRGDSAVAREHLTEALRLLPLDTDPQLDSQTRTRIQRQATALLDALRGSL